MKVTKQETKLYSFLRTVFDIAKKSKVEIIGHGNSLYFYSQYRKGKYTQSSDVRMAMEYNFSFCFYDLTMIPDGDFILEENEKFAEQDKFLVIDNTIRHLEELYEFDRTDTCQLAKMTIATGLMLCDIDLKYFNRFKEVTVSKNGTVIGMTSDYVEDEVEYETILLFDTNGHEVELNQQMNIDMIHDDHDEDEVTDLIEDTVEEADDEFDPMSV